MYKLYDKHKAATSSDHPSGNGGVQLANHAMAELLAMIVNECHVLLPHVEIIFNNAVRAASGYSPNEIHMGCFTLPSPYMYFEPMYPRPP